MHDQERRLAAIADEVLVQRTIVSRWAARDFKRRSTPDGLTATQFAILDVVDSTPGLNTRHLAEELDLAPPTVVRAVDALERKGLMQRHRHDRDGRQVVFALTPEGSRARAHLVQARRERLVHLLMAMTQEEIGALVLGYVGLARATRANHGPESASGQRCTRDTGGNSNESTG
jgi:DNA-binding MarR family transcriptional regulator